MSVCLWVGGCRVGGKDYGHLLALVSYRKAPIGVEHAFWLTPTDEDSHSATIVVLCFAIMCVWVGVGMYVCVCACLCVFALQTPHSQGTALVTVKPPSALLQPRSAALHSPWVAPPTVDRPPFVVLVCPEGVPCITPYSSALTQSHRLHTFLRWSVKALRPSAVQADHAVCTPAMQGPCLSPAAETSMAHSVDA